MPSIQSFCTFPQLTSGGRSGIMGASITAFPNRVPNHGLEIAYVGIRSQSLVGR